MANKLGQQFEGKEEYIKGVFEDIAPFYDKMNRVMTWGMVQGWRKFVLSQSGLTPGDKALDVCTGTGEMAFLLAERVGPKGEVVGLDFSKKMLDIAREKLRLCKKKGDELPRVLFMEGNALALPFPENYFDCVMMGFALRNVADVSLAVSEMARVCKAGGRVICLEISEPVNPLLRMGFKLYFYRIIPMLGWLAGKGHRVLGYMPAYAWLSLSLRNFPQSEGLANIFREANLREVRHYPLSGGVVTVYVGVKD